MENNTLDQGYDREYIKDQMVARFILLARPEWGCLREDFMKGMKIIQKENLAFYSEIIEEMKALCSF